MKLKREQAITKLFFTGKYTLDQIAKIHGVSKTHVSTIVSKSFKKK